MNYVFWLSLSMLIVLVFILALMFVSNKKIDNRALLCIMIMFIVSLSLIAYTIQPNVENDSYRHFEVIDYIRKYGFSACIAYNECIVFKIMLYLISLFPNNQILHLFAALVDYSLFSYLVYDYKKTYNPSSRCLSISILLSLSLVTFSTVISGIRSAMAIVILSLVFYFLLIKKHKFNFKLFLLILIAGLIHPLSYLVVSIYIFYLLFNKSNFKYISFFWSALVGIVIKLLEFLNLAYFAEKLKIYTEGNWIDDIRLYYITLIFLIFTLYVYFLIKKNKKIKHVQYIDFMNVYILFIFGSVFVAKIFVKRMLIFLAFGSIPFIDNVDNLGSKKIVLYLVYLFFIVGLIAYSVVEIRGNMIIPFNGY